MSNPTNFVDDFTDEKPILFSTPMVQAILEGRKTRHSSVIKERPIVKIIDDHSVQIDWLGVSSRRHGGLGVFSKELIDDFWEDICHQRTTNQVLCPYGQVGDRLWVRETFCYYHSIKDEQGNPKVAYKADIKDFCLKNFKWKPSIFMPRAVSRITLEITDIRVEQLQDISKDDAIKEGIDSCPSGLNLSSIPASEHFDVYFDYGKTSLPTYHQNPITSFKSLWDSINVKKHPWTSNPWVWVVEFKRVEK